MRVWDHDGRRYKVNSYYHLDSDTWRYELFGLSGNDGAGPDLVVSIPDANPGPGPFIPCDADRAVLRIQGGGEAPWPIVRRFVDLIEALGDIVGSRPDR